MIRRTLALCSIALLVSIGAPDPGCADEVAFEADERPEGRKEWRAQLLVANQGVAKAQKRNDAALRTYEIMRHRRHPRGEGKQEIMDELELARQELASAQLELERIEKAARRAGVPPSWLRFDPAELEVPAAAPESAEP
ncbi:MAG: hypothetical protein JRE43_01495 [Deltaproteobacteria bacterium]|jgi:hypothetical protein|nr:hypothetical protein [Deltaproteobacteria bacterium]MBW2542499.1 hypothetical protein [Deltaproteobacteria bacterium]